MSGILRLIAPGAKPLGPVAIDPDHPLSVGMMDCLVFTEGGIPINLAPGAPPTVNLTSNPTWKPTAMGLSGYATGGSAFSIPNHGNIAASDFAVRCLFYPVSWPANFTALFDKGSASPRQCAVFVATNGNLDFVSFGGTDQSVSTATGMTTGSIWDFVCSRSGTTVTYYVNGVSKGTATNSGTAVASSPAFAIGKNTSSGGANADAQYIAFQTWTRALSVSDVLALYNDPFGFLVPAENEMPALYTAAGGGPLMRGSLLRGGALTSRGRLAA